ncbi:MAG TPA: competence/damage-inducible protein A [Firmicutes bacterium]|jgi:nicotinamide-nucleotide amidase|nr:competence/damage-inducible protein A [Bacillota bacterium]
MRVELVMVGTELLLGEIVDTNAQWLAAHLAEIGVDVYFKSTVGDNWLRMVGVLAQALQRADVVLISGGLGPTEDDLTRGVIASVTGRPLRVLPEAEEHVRRYFQHAHRPMPGNNLRQAQFPEGALAIPNKRGTALGILLEHGDKTIIAVPGVPTEMRGMMEQTVLPYLTAKQGKRVTRSRVVHFYGLGESAMEELVADLVANQGNPTIAPYAGAGETRLRITARADSDEEAERLIAPILTEICRRGGDHIYGFDGASLEQVVGELLSARSQTLATAESCSGGLLAHRLTNIPGSSAYYMRGWITYSNAAKTTELGVPAGLIAEHGAVSPAVAEAMALGALREAGTTYALATTGIAGPAGGTATKPVGLVYIALADGAGTVQTAECRFRGERESIKTRTAGYALNMLRLHLLKQQ